MSQKYISQLRKKRLDRDLTLRHVAHVTGIPRSVLQRIETGKQSPKREQARKLFDFYDGEIQLSDIYDPMYRPVAA